MIPTTKPERAKLLKANRGLFRRVAEQTRVSPTHVAQVWHGTGTNARVRAAIVDELRRRSFHAEAEGGDNGR